MKRQKIRYDENRTILINACMIRFKQFSRISWAWPFVGENGCFYQSALFRYLFFDWMSNNDTLLFKGFVTMAYVYIKQTSIFLPFVRWLLAQRTGDPSWKHIIYKRFLSIRFIEMLLWDLVPVPNIVVSRFGRYLFLRSNIYLLLMMLNESKIGEISISCLSHRVWRFTCHL